MEANPCSLVEILSRRAEVVTVAEVVSLTNVSYCKCMKMFSTLQFPLIAPCNICKYQRWNEKFISLREALVGNLCIIFKLTNMDRRGTHRWKLISWWNKGEYGQFTSKFGTNFKRLSRKSDANGNLLREKEEKNTPPHIKTIPLDWLIYFNHVLKSHFSFSGQIVFICLLFLCNFPPISSTWQSAFFWRPFLLTLRGESSSHSERCCLDEETERGRGRGQRGGQVLRSLTRSFCSLKRFHTIVLHVAQWLSQALSTK